MTENGQSPNDETLQQGSTGDSDEFDGAAIRKLRDAVGALPREVAPTIDAWPAIRARIESARVRELKSPTGAGASARWWRSWPVRSALAATALIATGYVAQRKFQQQVAPSGIGDTAVTTAALNVTAYDSSRPLPTTTTSAGDNSSREMAASFARYDTAANELETDLKSKRERIDPETVAVLDSCVRTIDSAIAESKSALRKTPDDATVVALLAVAYQQKLDLLRRAGELPLRSF